MNTKKKITKVRNILLDKVSVLEKYEGIKVEKKVKKPKVEEITIEQVEKLLTEQTEIAQERVSPTIPQVDSHIRESSPEIAKNQNYETFRTRLNSVLSGKQRNRRAGR